MVHAPRSYGVLDEHRCVRQTIVSAASNLMREPLPVCPPPPPPPLFFLPFDCPSATQSQDPDIVPLRGPISLVRVRTGNAQLRSAMDAVNYGKRIFWSVALVSCLPPTEVVLRPWGSPIASLPPMDPRPTPDSRVKMQRCC